MNTSKKRGESVQEHKVPVGVPVWVQCEGYRCLAALDHKGQWRTYADGSKLSGVVKVLGESSGKRV